VIAKATDFIRQVKAELKKVTWPSRKDTYSSTLVVIVLVIFSAVYLGVVDLVLAKLARIVIG